MPEHRRTVRRPRRWRISDGRPVSLARLSRWILAATVAAATAAGALPAAGAARAPREVRPLDLRGFASEMDRLAARIADAPEADARSLRNDLPEHWLVRDGERTIQVSSAQVAAALAGYSHGARWSEERRQAAARLQTLAADARALDDARPPARDAAKATLDRILRAPEFARDTRSRWLEQWIAELRAQLASLMQRIGLNAAGVSDVSHLAAVAAIVAALGVCAWLVVRRTRSRRGRRQIPYAAAGPERGSWRPWATRAEAAAAAGDGPEAARCAYAAAVLRFEERGVWRVMDSRTPREYLALLPEIDGRTPAFKALLRDFEASWYGRRPVDTSLLLRTMEALDCTTAPRAT